jgi:hypothetical protein
MSVFQRNPDLKYNSAGARIDYMISRFNRRPTDPFLATYDDTNTSQTDKRILSETRSVDASA